MFVYPNPARDLGYIELDLKRDQEVHLYLMDANGQMAKWFVSGMMEAGAYNFPFEAFDFSSGVYMIVLRTDEGVQTEKVVIVN